MKKSLIIAAGAAFLGLASLTAPAVAMPMHGISSNNLAEIENVQYRPKHRHVRRKICKTERVVRRGPHGRPIVRHVRVCR
jgi:hypothetical protein